MTIELAQQRMLGAAIRSSLIAREAQFSASELPSRARGAIPFDQQVAVAIRVCLLTERV